PLILLHILSLRIHPPPKPTLFPYTTLFRSQRIQPPRRAPTARRRACGGRRCRPVRGGAGVRDRCARVRSACRRTWARYRLNSLRSEEHTSELQSRGHLVCRLLLEKKKKKKQ